MVSRLCSCLRRHKLSPDLRGEEEKQLGAFLRRRRRRLVRLRHDYPASPTDDIYGMAYCRPDWSLVGPVSPSMMSGMLLSGLLQVSDLPSWLTFTMQMSRPGPTRMLWGPLTKPQGRSQRVGRQDGECHALAGEEGRDIRMATVVRFSFIPSCPVVVVLVKC